MGVSICNASILQLADDRLSQGRRGGEKGGGVRTALGSKVPCSYE